LTRQAAITLVLVNALLSVALVAAHARWIAPGAQRLAVIDVASLYRAKEAQVAGRLSQRETSDEERLAILRQAGAFGEEVNALLATLPSDCRCLVLVRGAIAGSAEALPDFTPDARQRLGLH
jgi:hypothetical protein